MQVLGIVKPAQVVVHPWHVTIFTCLTHKSIVFYFTYYKQKNIRVMTESLPKHCQFLHSYHKIFYFLKSKIMESSEDRRLLTSTSKKFYRLDGEEICLDHCGTGPKLEGAGSQPYSAMATGLSDPHFLASHLRCLLWAHIAGECR